MKYFCIDISGSMDEERIIKACRLVEEMYTDGDLISVFDHSAAKPVNLYELSLVVKHKTTSELQRSLYKKRKRIVGFGMHGSKLAAGMADTDYKKVCITDGYITDDEASKYDEVIKL